MGSIPRGSTVFSSVCAKTRPHKLSLVVSRNPRVTRSKIFGSIRAVARTAVMIASFQEIFASLIQIWCRRHQLPPDHSLVSVGQHLLRVTVVVRMASGDGRGIPFRKITIGITQTLPRTIRWRICYAQKNELCPSRIEAGQRWCGRHRLKMHMAAVDQSALIPLHVRSAHLQGPA
jgi:hypothetical protein